MTYESLVIRFPKHHILNTIKVVKDDFLDKMESFPLNICGDWLKEILKSR